jgi:hypothetical protein
MSDKIAKGIEALSSALAEMRDLDTQLAGKRQLLAGRLSAITLTTRRGRKRSINFPSSVGGGNGTGSSRPPSE